MFGGQVIKSFIEFAESKCTKTTGLASNGSKTLLLRPMIKVRRGAASPFKQGWWCIFCYRLSLSLSFRNRYINTRQLEISIGHTNHKYANICCPNRDTRKESEQYYSRPSGDGSNYKPRKLGFYRLGWFVSWAYAKPKSADGWLTKTVRADILKSHVQCMINRITSVVRGSTQRHGPELD